VTETLILVQHGHATGGDASSVEAIHRTADLIAFRWKPNLIVTGPTERCRSTADIIGWKCGLLPKPEAALIPNCPTLHDLADRTVGVVMALLHEHPGQVAVIVNHETTSQLLVARLMGIDEHRYGDIAQDPCAVSMLRHEDGRWSLHILNETAHLNPIPRS